jgi:hypothetical protein
MISEELTRRLFLQGSGTVAGSVLIRAGLPAFIAATQAACTARDEGAAFENITNAEAREFEAIATRILPTTDTPGAREAGAIWFIDKTYGSMYADFLDKDRAMLADFQSGIAAAFPLAGVFGMSSYGGNRDGIGWQLLGMDGPPHAWSYPFGYYDAEYAKEQQNGK